MLRYLLSLIFAAVVWILPMVAQPVKAQSRKAHNPAVTWDAQSLLFDGHRVCPVMGEIHYSRIPAGEWRQEVRKMRDGGVTLLATYIFWNHIEEQQGIFRWDGQRNLRRFLEVCADEGMPVILRIGPWCHGEARNGGLPDWIFNTEAKLRKADPIFLQYVTRLYRQIFSQVQGLLWKDGGPVLACQFDNEYRGSGDYLMALKQIALEVGFDLPFYTRTGWPELSKPVPYGEMLPLYGDYADGFWDKEVTATAGNYYKAFNFKAFRSSTAIGTDVLGKQEAKSNLTDGAYPYFTCELGGGMVTSYHRRPYLYPQDAYSMAVVKLGSGSNLLGYYMYHGGTNPEGILNTLNECQTSPGTANNDLPVCTYDFQCPLGEFGQTYPQYYQLRKLHLFMHDYGEVLAPMEAAFPAPQDLAKGEDKSLRWAYRSKGNQAFVFVNNYERLQNLKSKHNVQFDVCGVRFPSLTIPAGTSCIFPVNIDGIRYATAQLIAKRDGKIYLEQIPGIATHISVDGKTLRNLKPLGPDKPVYRNICLLTSAQAEHLFLPVEPEELKTRVEFSKVRQAGALRSISKGPARVASAPTEEDWNAAAVYQIDVPEQHDGLLHITYRGDCARLYANGHLVADNFYYGRPFLYGLWRLPVGCRQLEMRILPLQPEAPIYLPAEADIRPGEELISCEFTASARKEIDLSGEWKFAMGDNPTYTDHVQLPGSMLTNGKGHDVSVETQWTGSLYDSSYFYNPTMQKYRQLGKMKFPFFLTPQKQYVGVAWYERTVSIPADWNGKPVTLYLERPHIETTLYVNGDSVGHQMSLSAPHQYDVSPYLRPGQDNRISLRIYNGIENVCVGQDSHSVTDQTQGNWNGIAGRIELQQRPLIWRLNVQPHLADHSVDILVNDTCFHIDMGSDVQTWDEFNPHLYTRSVRYRGTDIPVTFGMREVSIEGTQFLMNGRPVWMRGTVENCCFPETGYPPTDVESWLRIFQQCKAHGINHMRFHSYCPPDAAFTAADQCGMYLQPEGPSWPNHGVKLRAGMTIDQYLLDEGRRILDTYGHHPSLVMMAAGNEPAGDWVRYCNDWVEDMRQYDPTRLYCGASVGGGWAWDNGSQYHVKGGGRGLDWVGRAPQSADDYRSSLLFPRNYKDSVPNNSPIVAHEQGQWCAFPDLSEVDQYTGAYKARNFEIFADLLKQNGMSAQAHKFLMASGKLQTLCYKYEIERNMRTKDYAGFQLLALNDYSGQGTALEGILNVHWRSKGYCTADQWRQFCAPLVPLARFSRFVFTSADTLQVPVEAMNATTGIVKPQEVTYTITKDNGELFAQGSLSANEIPLGKNHTLGVISRTLSDVQQPTRFTLTVSIDTQASNSWQFWVYPAQLAMPETNVYVTDTLDAKAIDILGRGGNVLLTAAGKVSLGDDIVQHYVPVFWNTSWFKMRPPHTTGATIDTRHPLFSYGFPTDDWSNLNWWELLNRAQVMNLMELPADYQSPIQPIDTWHISRKLGMMIEARVLKGRLLMTTLDVTTDLNSRVVARQMRYALLKYMQSSDFQPALNLDIETIQHFFTHRAPAVNMFTKDSPDELKPKLK